MAGSGSHHLDRRNRRGDSLVGPQPTRGPRHRRRNEPLDFPISWVHHWVWVVPLAGACAALAVRARGAGQRGASWALIMAALLTALPPIIQWRFEWVQILPFDRGISRELVGMGYATAAIATIAILAVALRLPKGSYETDPTAPILRAQPTDAR